MVEKNLWFNNLVVTWHSEPWSGGNERHLVKGHEIRVKEGLRGGGRSTFFRHCLCTSKFVWSAVWTMEKRKGDWFTLVILCLALGLLAPSAFASSASTTYSTDTDVGVVVSLPLFLSLPISLPLDQLFPFYDSVVFAWRRGFTIFLYPPSRTRWRRDLRRRRNGNDASKRLWRRPTHPSSSGIEWMRLERISSLIICNEIFVLDYFMNSYYSCEFFISSRWESVVIGNGVRSHRLFYK